MYDLIDRQAAINLLKKWSDGYTYIETETELAIKEFQHLPSAEKRGRCLNKARYFYCSECCYAVADVFEGAKTDDKKVYLFEKGKTWNYCPNCGAKIEGEG